MFSYKGTVIIKYSMKALTGLRVGGTKENFDIGGWDNPVIKTLGMIEDYDGRGNNLPEGAPYIPGSSLKGKMRSLLEWAKGRVEYMIDKKNSKAKNDVERERTKRLSSSCVCGRCEVCKVFGTGSAKTLESLNLRNCPDLQGSGSLMPIPLGRVYKSYRTPWVKTSLRRSRRKTP